MAVIPEAFAIMGVDPGGKTGVAQGIFRASPASGPSVKGTLRRAARRGAWRANVIDADPVRTAVILAQSWLDFRYTCTVEFGIPLPNVYLAVENFQLRQMAVDLSPVEVAAGFAVLVRNDVTEIKRPMPSEHMGYATTERRKLWRVYELGRGRGWSDHAHMAISIVCLGVNKCLDGKW